MNDFQKCAGINFTSSKLQFAEIEKVNNQAQINNSGQTFVRPPINFTLPDENFVQAQLQSAYEELKVRYPIIYNIVSFTLPTELFITIQLPYDKNLNQAEIREEISWEISQLYPHLNIDDLALKFYEMESSLFPTKQNALVVALDKKFLRLIKNFSNKNNLIPKLVDSASITANSFINNFYSNKGPINIHLFNERNSITLFINIFSMPAYVKVFPKRTSYFINKLTDECSKKNIKDAIKNRPISAILSGEELESDLLEEIGRGTELVFEKLNPFNLIKSGTGVNQTDLSNEHDSSFISAIGIASRFGQN
jgi:Tfp pilus assembly PilM family ATPase